MIHGLVQLPPIATEMGRRKAEPQPDANRIVRKTRNPPKCPHRGDPLMQCGRPMSVRCDQIPGGRPVRIAQLWEEGDLGGGCDCGGRERANTRARSLAPIQQPH